MAWTDDDRVKFENDLINQRLTWLGVFEGLLFVADSHGAHPYLLPVAGIAIAVSVARGTFRANQILDQIPPPAHLTVTKDRFGYVMPGTAIPATITFAWGLILMQNFTWWRSMVHCLASTLGFS